VRIKSAATVLGNYVYIDGGELKIFSSRGRLLEGIETNFTLSIDLSKSWTTSDVAIQAIPKAAPKKTGAALWTDNQSGVFYSWGGAFPSGQHENISAPELWKFTADGQGGGSWSTVQPSNGGAFLAIHPADLLASANTDTMAFALGGVRGRWAEPGDEGDNQPVYSGMVTYGFASHQWTNDTENGPFPTLVGASAHYLPSFGSNGLIMTLGGHSPPEGNEWIHETGKAGHDFLNLTFFDPETKQAYWQLTSGDLPLWPRVEACTALVEAPDGGGYEMYVFRAGFCSAAHQTDS